MSGSLCSDLCEQNKIHLRQCLSTVPEKQIYDADWGGRQVILKVNMSWFEEFEKRQNITGNDAAISYKGEISSRVRTLFGDCPRCSELTSILVLLGDGNGDGSVTSAEARTFISLLQHLEPAMLMALNESKYIVDFYGYCGGLYVVEKVPFIASKVFENHWEPLDFSFISYGEQYGDALQEMLNNFLGEMLNTAIFSVQYCCAILNNALDLTRYHIFNTFFQMLSPSKREKFKVAYSMLDATLDFANNTYGLVRQCDGHLANYGITSNALVKIIDLDLMYPHVFLKMLLEQKSCISGSDCWVGSSGDCFSTCNTSKGSCTSQMEAHDLHIICEVLFPVIFRGPNILEPQGHNTTFLTKAIKKLGVFCSNLPVVYSIEKMRREILAVKRKLRAIEIQSSENC